MFRTCLYGVILFINIAFPFKCLAVDYINNLSNAEKIAKKEDKPLLVIFSMENCIHCDILKDEISKLDNNDYIVCIVQIEKNIRLAKEYNILLYPTSLILDTKLLRTLEVSRFTGYSSDYIKWLDKEKKDRF